MAAPSYTEDLTDIATGDEASGWVNWSTNQQGTPSYQDADYPYIQGSYAVTQTCSKSKAIGNLGYDYGSTITLATDGAFFVWQSFSSPFAIDDYNGTTTGTAGMSVLVGDDTSNFELWEVGGKDKSPMPYGGWQCHAVNTTVTPDAYPAGTKTIDRYCGAQVNLTTYPSKGEVHQVDMMRFGRGSAIFESGDLTNGYCTIAGFAAQNDNQSNRWGLIQEVAGGYLWQGRMQLGSSGTAVDFRDSDRIIFIKWCPKVTSNFNTIEVINASSRVDMTNFQFIQLDTSTASDGRWITTNDADVNLELCSFQDMGTFTFDSNTTADECTWARCLQIDPGGGDLSYSNVLSSAVTGGGSAGGGALLWNDAGDPDTKLNDMTFTKGAGSHHAIEFGTSAPTTINLTNMTFTDFSASDQQTTSVLYFPDKGSDTTWTVSHTGTTGTISYYKARSGDTVTISGSVPVTVTVYDKHDGLVEASVQTAVYKTSDRTQIMNEDTNASGVATENYTGSTPVEVEVRCRKASSGADKFKNYSSIQQIGASGLSLSVTMERDDNNNATT
jgi:hypothetical protein